MKTASVFAAALLTSAAAGAGLVTTHCYMGTEYDSDKYVPPIYPLNANVGSSPVTFTVTNTPSGWKITDWLTAATAADIPHLDRCTSTGVSSATYEWTGGTATASALAVRFDPISYTLSFDTAGGSPFSEAEPGPYLSTNEISLVEYTGTLEGHSFVGWTNEYVTTAFDHTEPFTGVGKLGLGNADTNVVLHAVWTANVYTVTFGYAKNAAGEWTNAVQHVRHGEDAIPPSKETVDVWSGWHFTGWEGTYTAVSASHEVEAQYKQNVYTVAYDPNCTDASGEMANNSFTYGEDGSLSENQFSRAGYVFGGWNTKPDGSGKSYRNGATVRDLTGENHAIVTLYAQWLPISYTIAFYGGEDAVGEMAPTNILYGQEVALPTNSFVNEGRSFKGWDFEDRVIADGATVSNLTTTADATATLVARWSEYQSQLQRAIHCDNLFWDGVEVEGLGGDIKWIARSGGGLGYNGSGSCAEQTGKAGDALTAMVTTNGVLSFYCRNDSSEQQAKLMLSVNTYENQFFVGDPIIDTDIDLEPNTGWQLQTYVVSNSQNQANMYVRFAVLFGTVQIDQMKWEPEGGEPGEISIDVTGFAGKYDGVAHGVSVAVSGIGAATYDVRYAVSDGEPAESDWGDDVPMFTDVSSNTVWCVVSADGFDPKTNNAAVVVSPREVTLTSGSASKVYDGEPLVCGDAPAVGGDGFADGEGATFDVTGSQTDAGTSPNTFTYTLNENTKAANYSITTTPGTLKVTKASYDMTGVGWDYTEPFEYDGRKKAVSLVGLPDGLSVSYVGNTATRPGKYEAVATFTSASPNYETPMDEFLEWEIVASGAPVFPGEGTVTIPKTWTVGKSATWKAKAAKGSVFAHWEGKLVDSLGLSLNELRNPSLKFTVPEGFDTNDVDAVFVSFDSDGLSSLSLSFDEALDFGVAVEGLEVLDDSESYVTASVSGLPSGLKFDKKTMAITGTPKKSGAFIVKITAKNASGYQWAENVALRVKDAGGNVPRKPDVPEPKRTAYHSLTVVSSDLAAGTVSGTGVYAEGKKASISAKPAKGRSFAGWYCDAALTEPMEFVSGDYRKASQSVVIPEVRCLFAKYVAATAEADPISGLAAKGPGLFAEDSFAWRVGVAVPDGDGIEFDSASLPSASAAKLPAGVKFDAAKGRFTGVPTKAGTYEATVKVKNASKSAAELKLTIEVAALDVWAQGTFNGAAFDGDDNNPTGQVSSLTVGAKGKISGKLLRDGLTWTLSAASFDSYDETGDAYFATVIGKSGKLQITNEVTVTAEPIVAPDGSETVRGVADCDEWTAWQNKWKTEPWKTEAKAFGKAPQLPVEGGVTLKFASSGAVTAKLGSYSCSTVLVPVGGAFYRVSLYFAPKAGKFEGYSAEVMLEWDGAAFSEAPIYAP